MVHFLSVIFSKYIYVNPFLYAASDFFAGNGVTTFCKRMASVLRIDISRVKVVSVFEGSLNVQVQILSAVSRFVMNDDFLVQPSPVAFAGLN